MNVTIYDCAFGHNHDPCLACGRTLATVELQRREIECLRAEVKALAQTVRILQGVKEEMTRTWSPPAVVETLRKYVAHSPTCMTRIASKWAYDVKCDCGLEAALAAAGRDE